MKRTEKSIVEENTDDKDWLTTLFIDQCTVDGWGKCTGSVCSRSVLLLRIQPSFEELHPNHAS